MDNKNAFSWEGICFDGVKTLTVTLNSSIGALIARFLSTIMWSHGLISEKDQILNATRVKDV